MAPPPKAVKYQSEAARALARMQKPVAERIMEKINLFAREPEALRNNLKTLKPHHTILRLRVGDWRVLLDDRPFIVVVIDVKPRSSAYK